MFLSCNSLLVKTSPTYSHTKAPFGRSSKVRRPHPFPSEVKNTWNTAQIKQSLPTKSLIQENFVLTFIFENITTNTHEQFIHKIYISKKNKYPTPSTNIKQKDRFEQIPTCNLQFKPLWTTRFPHCLWQPHLLQHSLINCLLKWPLHGSKQSSFLTLSSGQLLQ